MNAAIDRAVVGLCARLPRGGYALAKVARLLRPSLAEYPARTRFGDFKLRGDIAQNVFYPLAIRGYYAHQTVEDDLLAALARDSKVIVDVGGNIGFTSALMATFAPHAEIVVFEPLPLCQLYLAQVTTRFANVRVIAKAVADAPGRAEFLQRQNIDRSSLSGKGDAPVTDVVQVDVSTLDAELAGLNVDLIKIDVEGFEPAVLRGGRQTIARAAPAIVFEAYEADVLEFARQFFSEMPHAYALYAINSAGTLRALEHARGTAPDTCNYLAWPSRTRPFPGFDIPRCYAR